jgi:predicted nucleotidyltransferase
VTINMVQAALIQLLKRGVIKTTPSGDAEVYEMNRSTPWYPGIHRIALADLGLADLLRPLADDIMAVLVYGSVVDGQARPDSDLDILVVGLADEIDIERALAPLKVRLERRIDVSALDYFQFRSRRTGGDSLVTKALNRGILVMGRIPE